MDEELVKMFNTKHATIISILFFLPALLIMLMFFVMPILSTFYFSLYDWSILNNNMQYVGIKNYIKVFNSPEFITALKNTIVYTILVAFFNNFFGLLLGVALDTGIKSRNILRAAFFIPSLISAVVSGYIWTFLYHPEFGGSSPLIKALHMDFLNQDWLGNPKLVIYAIAFVAIWQYSGYYMVIYLTGLQSIPAELYEACKIDGSNWWIRFFKITFPMLAPSITIGIVTATIGSLKVFDHVFVMTKGGPGYASETLTSLLVTQTFFSNRAGYGVTISVILFILVMVVSFVQLNILRKRENIF